MKIILVLVLVAGFVLGLGGGSAALAAEPAVKGCVGESVSANAAAGADFGHFVAVIARDKSFNNAGVGDDVQALQAGLVPDEDFANTCNQ